MPLSPSEKLAVLSQRAIDRQAAALEDFKTLKTLSVPLINLGEAARAIKPSKVETLIFLLSTQAGITKEKPRRSAKGSTPESAKKPAKKSKDAPAGQIRRQELIKDLQTKFPELNAAQIGARLSNLAFQRKDYPKKKTGRGLLTPQQAAFLTKNFASKKGAN